MITIIGLVGIFVWILSIDIYIWIHTSKKQWEKTNKDSMELEKRCIENLQQANKLIQEILDTNKIELEKQLNKIIGMAKDMDETLKNIPGYYDKKLNQK